MFPEKTEVSRSCTPNSHKVLMVAGVRCVDASCVLVYLSAERHGPAGQGYCQGGFSADFTKVQDFSVGVFAVFVSTQALFLVVVFFYCCK